MEERTPEFMLKTEMEGLKVEFECSPELPSIISEKRETINNRIVELDGRITDIQKKVDEYNDEIDRLTNHADKIDYIVAVSSGVLTGLIDVFFVGEFDFSGSREKVGDKFDEVVQKNANKLREKEVKQKAEEAIKKAQQEAKEKGKTLSDEEIKKIHEKFNKKLQEPLDKEKSIRFLEERFGIPSDSVYEKTNKSINEQIKKIIEDAEKKGSPLSNDEIKKLKEKMKTKISHDSHHLDDLTHHPSVLGLAASIAQQFGAKAVFQNRDGKTIPIAVETIKTVRRGKEVIEIQLIGEDLRSKLACGIFNWVMHLLSDAAGSSSAAHKGNPGMGLPGPIMSFLKEAAMIPGLNKTSLPEKLYELFTQNQDFLNGYSLDLRSELAIGMELGKQAIPVFINTIFVRSFYFFRHFIQEVKDNGGFKGLDVKAALKRSMPFKNRTVTRMITIASGTFMMVDMIDAAAETAIKNPQACASVPTFLGAMMLRVNFVGIGRFAIAVTSDVGMGINKVRDESDRAILMENLITSCEAKLYYVTADNQLEMASLRLAEKEMHEEEAEMWEQVEQTQESISELYKTAYAAGEYYANTIQNMNETFDAIEEDVSELRETDPDFLNEMLRRLK